jgi:hypothetical protein
MSKPSLRRHVRVLVSVLGMLSIAVGLTTNFGTRRASALTDDVDKHLAELSGAVEFAKRADIEVDTPDEHHDGGGSRNILVNQDRSNFPHDETVIAVNPRNAKNLVAGANDYRLGYGSSGFYSSQDGGRTWYDGIIPVPSWPDGDVPAGGGDPVTLFDSNGTAYYVGLAFDRATDRSAIVVSRSTNGGQTWSRPSFTTKDGVAVANLQKVAPSVFHDKEWGAFDTTTGKANSHPNRLYITWTRFEGAPLLAPASPIYEVHSDDSARTFSAPHEISGSSTLCDFRTGGTVARRCGDNQPSWPVVGPDGTVYVFFRNQDTPAENQFLMVKSSDGGVTFSAPIKVADDFDVNYPTGRTTRPDCTARGQSSTRRVLSNSCFRVNSYGGPAVASDGTLYLVWSDNRNGNNVHTDVDVFLARSTDAGESWSHAIRVNQDPIGNGKDQFFPWPAVAPDGTVYVVYHDRRLDTTSTITAHGVAISPPGNYLVDSWVSRSNDRGESWKDFRVSDVSSNFDFGFRAGIFLGDYSGLAATSDVAYPFFTDARNGTAAVRHSDVYLSIVSRENRDN